MRDKGVDFFSYDPSCENIFSQDRVIKKIDRQFLAVTAFEVFEHWVNPLEGMKEISDFTDTIIFSTCLLPEDIQSPDEWWYFGLEHGQHVSLYAENSLKHLGLKYGMELVSRDNSLHALSRSSLSSRQFNFLTSRSLGLATQFDRGLGLFIAKLAGVKPQKHSENYT